MELREITETPEFHPDVPEYARKGLTPQELYFAEQLSITRQQNTWIIDRMIMLNNVVVNHDTWFQRVVNPLTFIVAAVVWVLTWFGPWILGELRK